MILNALSITELFVQATSSIAAVWAGAVSLSLYSGWRNSRTIEDRLDVEARSHLVLLAAVVVLCMRMLNWPLFYATLKSFVPELPGAMCIFGVTQVNRVLTGVSELIKPLSFFLMGAWLLLHMLDQRSRTSTLMGRKLVFLAVTAFLVAAESITDIMVIFGIAPGNIVSCCTTVTDVLDRPTLVIPRSYLGSAYARLLEHGYFVGNCLLIAVTGLLLGRLDSMGLSGNRRLVLGSVFAYAVLNAALFLLTQIEVHAPRAMNLPFHHCIYCLWQYVPDTILMYGLFLIGTSAIGWAFLLDVLVRSEETREALDQYLRRLYGCALFCLSSSLAMNAVHAVFT